MREDSSERKKGLLWVKYSLKNIMKLSDPISLTNNQDAYFKK